MSSNPRPIGARLLVKVLDDEVDKERIWLPDGSRSWSLRGMVVAIGQRVEEVEVADEILFDKNYAARVVAPRDVALGQQTEELWLVEERYVICVLDATRV